MHASIRSIAYHLPERVTDNRQLEREFSSWSADKIEKKTGIRERHISGLRETALDLAVKASERVLADGDRSEIDFILFCTQSPDHYLPPNACILQDRLGLGTHTGAFDFNLGCSGFVYGLALAKGLIRSGSASCVLLVTSETYTKHIHPQDKGNRTIFGDAAAATVVAASEREGVLEFALGTDGSGFEHLIVPNGGLRHRYDPRAEIIDDGTGSPRTDNHLFMNGPEIFNFTIEAVPKVVHQVLRKNDTRLEDLDYVVFHQANKYIIEYLRKKLSIPEEKFYNRLAHTGNTVSSTIPIAMRDAMDAGWIGKGDRVLLVGFGVGLSWGATIVEM